MKSLISIAIAVMLLTGCGAMEKEHWNDELVKRASFDLQCPESALTVTPLSDSYHPETQGVQGCKKRAVYVYSESLHSDSKWLRNGEVSPAESAPPH